MLKNKENEAKFSDMRPSSEAKILRRKPTTADPYHRDNAVYYCTIIIIKARGDVYPTNCN